MSVDIRNMIWEKVKQVFNQNPDGIMIDQIIKTLNIKENNLLIKDNYRSIIIDYTDTLRSAGFLKLIFEQIQDPSIYMYSRMYQPIWKIPENITITEVVQLSKQPDWMLWFLYPEGNLNVAGGILVRR